MILVRCARVPTHLPTSIAASWIDTLPKQHRMVLTRRLSRGHGLDSLTGLALLAGFSSDGHLPVPRRLRWNIGGKPYFSEGPDFSITHSAGFAACAVAPKNLKIGIDLECVDRVRMAAIRLVANNEERAALDRGYISPAELWTAKEAVLKASGAGLPEIGRVGVDGDRAHFAGVDYHVRSFRLKTSLLLAIAMERPIPEPVFDWRSPTGLFGVDAEYAHAASR